MCNIAWHPILRAIANRARTKVASVLAVFAALGGEGDNAPLFTAEILAAGLGLRERTIARILEAMATEGVMTGGAIALAWRRVSSEPDVSDAEPDAELQNRTPFGRETGRRQLSSNPSSVRSRQKYWRDKDLAAASENRTQPSSLYLFKRNNSLQEKTNKQNARAWENRTASDFSELARLWPINDRMAEAQAEYERYRRRHDAPTILAAARRYLEQKPPGRYCMFLINWLRTDPCREPALPLAAAPIVVPRPKLEPLAPAIGTPQLAEDRAASRLAEPIILPEPKPEPLAQAIAGPPQSANDRAAENLRERTVLAEALKREFGDDAPSAEDIAKAEALQTDGWAMWTHHLRLHHRWAVDLVRQLAALPDPTPATYGPIVEAAFAQATSEAA